MNWLFWIIIFVIIAEFAIGQYLSRLNAKSWSDKVPEELEGLYDEDKYAKAQAYDRERSKLSNISGYFSLVLLLGMFFFGGFAWLNGLASGFTDSPVVQAMIFFGALFFASDILSMPFGIYAIFHIEDKYGFNKMTWKTYFLDKLKSWALAVLIGGGMIGLIVWYFYLAGPLFWLYAWITVTVVMILFAMFNTTVFVPLFNKLSPLGEGPLREKIEAFADKVAFPLKNIMVMDGSKRSSKANAFFSGIGGRKSIVLFDTLLEDQTEEELVAILAHEVGHYKMKHIQKGIAVSILHTGLLFFLIGLFAGSEPVSAALAASLGISEPSFHISLLVFTILYSPISMITGVMMNYFSRKNEFEADKYARDNYRAEPLVSSLKKLSINHLTNLQPHPLYVFFYYSHPPLLQRIRNLRSD